MVAGEATGMLPEKLAGSLLASARVSMSRVSVRGGGFARASGKRAEFHAELSNY
jgi:hypothetical protein